MLIDPFSGMISMRYAARQLLGVSDEDFSINFGKFGKPDISGLAISVSHTSCPDKSQVSIR